MNFGKAMGNFTWGFSGGNDIASAKVFGTLVSRLVERLNFSPQFGSCPAWISYFYTTSDFPVGSV